MENTTNSTNPNITVSNETTDVNPVVQEVLEGEQSLEKTPFTTFTDTTATTKVAEQKLAHGLEKLSVYKEPSFQDYFKTSWQLPKCPIDWEITHAVGDIIQEYSLPSALFSITQLWNRVRGFKYLRANIELGFRLNATNFHYGALVASVYPCVGGRNGFGYFNFFNMTANPHVILQPTQHETKTLTLGWNFPKFWWDIERFGSEDAEEKFEETSMMEWRLVIYVLNPLLTTNDCTEPVRLTVFAKMIEPKYNGITESTSEFTSATLIPIASPVYTETFTLYELAPFAAGEVAQGPIMEGIEKATKGITSLAESAGKATASVVGGISSVTGLLDKPFDPTPPRKFYPQWEPLTHGNGNAMCPPLSLDVRNSTMSLPFPSQITAYDFESICATPMLIFTKAVDSTSLNVPFTLPVGPSVVPATTQTTDVIIFHTPFTYIAFAHDFWKADLVFTFQIVCSSFHSGRFRVVWKPGNSALVGANSVDLTTLPSLVNKVFDVNTNSTFTFTVPYLRDYGFMGHYNTSSSFDINGSLMFTVMNPVTSMCTTPGAIQPMYVNVWLHAQNVQFGRPTCRYFSANIPTFSPTGEVAQAGGKTTKSSNSESRNTFVVPGAVDFQTHALKGFYFGEESSDVLTLMKRWGGPIAQAGNYAFRWCMPRATFSGSALSPFAYFAQWWRWSRGPWRLKALSTGPVAYSFNSYTVVVTSADNFVAASSPSNFFISSQGLVRTPVSRNTVGEIEIPFYTNLLFFPFEYPTFEFKMPVVTDTIEPENEQVYFYEAAGDSFEMYWRGAPPTLTIPQSSIIAQTPFANYAFNDP